MSRSEERLLFATGHEQGSGWAAGCFGSGDHRFSLLELTSPVGRLEPGSCREGLTIAFSGPGQSEIPWGSASWEALTSEIESLAPQPRSLAMRGHHQDVLADAPACLGWLDRAQKLGLEVGVALSPASMLVASMMSTLDEHLERMFDYLGGRAVVVILEDLESEDDELVGRMAGQGILPGAFMGRLIDRYVPVQTPILVHAYSLEAARGWLWPNMPRS